MKKIEEIKFIEASKPDIFHQKLIKAMYEMQLRGNEIEVSHSMCPDRHHGYMYSAIVVGRQE